MQQPHSRNLLSVAAALTVTVLVAAGLLARNVSAAELGAGLDLQPFSQITHEFAPAVEVADTFPASGNLNAKKLEISGTSMAPTTTGAPAWATLTNANRFTLTGSGAATRTTSVSGTNKYSPARIPWMGRKFSLQGSLSSITSATDAGFLILAASNGNSGIAAQFLRSPNVGDNTDRWKLRIVQITSVSSGVAAFTVVAQANLFNNSTSNPAGAEVAITLDFDPDAASNLSAAIEDAAGNQASLTTDVNTSAGVYTGLVSFAPSSTLYPEFSVRMT